MSALGHPRRHASILTRILTLLLIFVAVPGAIEVVDDLAHYTRDGHTAHDAGHEREDPDHCCSGLFHLCACHAQASATPLDADPWDAPPSEALAIQGPSGALASGHRVAPFRPPSV